VSTIDTVGRILDFVRARKKSYALCFMQPAGNQVLIDLADFCRAAETCVVTNADGSIDRNRSLVLEGRREVWLRIQNHLNLSSEDLYRLATGRELTYAGVTDNA